MSSFLSRKSHTQRHHYFQSFLRRANVCPLQMLARIGWMKVTSASRMWKHLKRAETNEESSDFMKSKTCASLTVEIPVEDSRRKRPHSSCGRLAHALPVPAAYRLLGGSRYRKVAPSAYF
ncbi:hypothetical protein M405DRAFT_54042 [Rhizopogon salebrosus TDB-379]|nr:hypothetical protein M405DRAFT_54042 [Rhizopogon salebrosus TDB-379]